MSSDPTTFLTVAPAVVAVQKRGLDLSAARFPAEHTPLVGREPEIMGIQALLSRPDVRLLTVTGPGGGGKTRVAVRGASRAAGEFVDGAAFVSLVPVRDPELVAPAIFQALGGRDERVDFSIERFHDLIGDRQLLLVLDNFEHLVSAAPVVSDLLASCPRLKVLVTSRLALRLSGEHEFHIPPMSLPDPDLRLTSEQALHSDAVRLFVQRARAARSEFDPSADALVAVARICQHLDGLPLAIELAAARITHLSPSALLQRLDRPAATRLPLLTGGARDQPARFQTMHDTIAWSYDLLDASEQDLFQALSVFPAGFSLDAAEVVSRGEDGETARWPDGQCGREVEESSRRDGARGTEDGSDPLRPPSPVPPLPPHHPSPLSTLDLLASLVARSLIFYEGEKGGAPSYGMLQTIREFGRERLTESGREAAVRQRHAEWALALAERAGPTSKGPEAAASLEALERDHPSLRVALGWFVDCQDGPRLARMAGSLWSFWQEHAHYAEGRRWLAQALALGQDIPAKDRLRLLTGAGAMAWYQTDVNASRQMHEQALELARELGDRGAEAFELNNLGVHASHLGENVLAIARFEASVAASGAIDDPDPKVLALHNLAYLYWEQGDLPRAMNRLQESLDLARQHRMGWILPSILAGLGVIATDQGDHERAVGHFHEGISLAQARGNPGDIVDSIEGLGRLAGVTDQAEAAARLFGAADALRLRLETPLLPEERAQIVPILERVRAAIGEGAFAAAWAAGGALSTEEAIADALALRPERPAPHSALRDLTERELDVLRLIASGSSNREIGDALYISPATAARHVANIYGKLEIDSRAKATALAHEHGLIPGVPEASPTKR
jgi:predicted ATPase/DNA-binding CsgD family transcriptional regulator/Tfp pilus assembly protein PilF